MMRKLVLLAAVLVGVCSASAEWWEAPGGELNEEQLAAGRDTTIEWFDRVVTLTGEQKQKMRERLEARDKAYLEFFSKNRPRLRELERAVRQAQREDARIGDDELDDNVTRRAFKAYEAAIAPIRQAFAKAGDDMMNEVLTPQQQAEWRKSDSRAQEWNWAWHWSWRNSDILRIDEITPLSDLQQRKLHDAWAAYDKKFYETLDQYNELRAQQKALQDDDGHPRADLDEADRRKFHQIEREKEELLWRLTTTHSTALNADMMNVFTSEQKLTLKTVRLAELANEHVRPFALDAVQIDQLKPHFASLMESDVFRPLGGWSYEKEYDAEPRLREKARALLSEDQRYEVERAEVVREVQRRHLWWGGVRLTEEQRRQLVMMYDDLKRTGLTKQLQARLGEESGRLLTAAQKDAILKGLCVQGFFRFMVASRPWLTDEQKAQFHAADAEKDKPRKAALFESFVRTLSSEQKDEFLHYHWRPRGGEEETEE